MATDHTDGEPPSLGNTILVNIGWMAKISSAERKSVTVYRGSVNRRAGATFGVGENSAVFPIEVILFIRLHDLFFSSILSPREHGRHRSGSACGLSRRKTEARLQIEAAL